MKIHINDVRIMPLSATVAQSATVDIDRPYDYGITYYSFNPLTSQLTLSRNNTDKSIIIYRLHRKSYTIFPRIMISYIYNDYLVLVPSVIDTHFGSLILQNNF